MTKDQDDGLEKVLTANLARAVDWLKFAETKNAALLTFSSAWIIGLLNYIYGSAPIFIKTCASWGIPLFVLAALLAIMSFIPRTLLGSFYSRKTSISRDRNLLFFGDIKDLKIDTASQAFRSRYTPENERKIADKYIDDLSVQLLVISRIAYHKFRLFDWGAAAVIAAFLVMVIIVPIIIYIQTVVSAANGP